MGVLIDRIGMPATQAGAGVILALFVAAFVLGRRPARKSGAVAAD